MRNSEIFLSVTGLTVGEIFYKIRKNENCKMLCNYTDRN